MVIFHLLRLELRLCVKLLPRLYVPALSGGGTARSAGLS